MNRGAQKLADLLQRNALKKVDFAIIACVGQTNVSRIVAGQVPSLKHYSGIARAAERYGVTLTIEDFLSPAEPTQPMPEAA